jgi:hypothetical protein
MQHFEGLQINNLTKCNNYCPCRKIPAPKQLSYNRHTIAHAAEAENSMVKDKWQRNPDHRSYPGHRILSCAEYHSHGSSPTHIVAPKAKEEYTNTQRYTRRLQNW